jgi:hypothetical protein
LGKCYFEFLSPPLAATAIFWESVKAVSQHFSLAQESSMRIRARFIFAATLVLPTVALGAPPNNGNFNGPSNFGNARPLTATHGGFPPGKGGLPNPRGRSYKGQWYAYGSGPCWKAANGRYHWIC